MTWDMTWDSCGQHGAHNHFLLMCNGHTVQPTRAARACVVRGGQNGRRGKENVTITAQAQDAYMYSTRAKTCVQCVSMLAGRGTRRPVLAKLALGICLSLACLAPKEPHRRGAGDPCPQRPDMLHEQLAPDAMAPTGSKGYVPTSGPLAEPCGPLYMPLNLDYPGLRKVHQQPPIYVCDNFLTHEECDAFITTAGPLLQRSKTHAIAGSNQARLPNTLRRSDFLCDRLPLSAGLTSSLISCLPFAS